MKDKAGQHLEVDILTTNKSADDLEVDNILSHSNVEQPTAEYRANLIVSKKR